MAKQLAVQLKSDARLSQERRSHVLLKILSKYQAKLTEFLSP